MKSIGNKFVHFIEQSRFIITNGLNALNITDDLMKSMFFEGERVFNHNHLMQFNILITSISSIVFQQTFELVKVL